MWGRVGFGWPALFAPIDRATDGVKSALPKTLREKAAAMRAARLSQRRMTVVEARAQYLKIEARAR